MKKWHKYLIYLLLLLFAAWMTLTHEPKRVQAARILGMVTGPINNDLVPIQLADGEQISVKAPGQLPKQRYLKVYVEVTDYRWSGKRSYRITNWKSR